MLNHDALLRLPQGFAAIEEEDIPAGSWRIEVRSQGRWIVVGCSDRKAVAHGLARLTVKAGWTSRVVAPDMTPLAPQLVGYPGAILN